MRTLSLSALGIAALAFVASGCVHEVHHHHHDKHKAHKGGPPPWAPAHGYRHKHHHGVELVFDAGLDVYVVVGHPGIYFRSDEYYCLRGGEWYAGPRFDGPWKATRLDHLPPGLRKKYAKGQPGKGKGHGKKHGRGHDD
jgi:hypothetical protein